MKRFAVALVLAALPFAASASPQLASDWGIKAGDLREETANLIAAIDASGKADISDDYEIEIGRFAMTATRLGHWIDGNEGPSDLGCIFRGMAEEGEVQLDALSGADSTRAKRQSLVRLATMFSDAEAIAVAAQYANRHDGPAAELDAVSCPVSADAARAALK
ncbi:hypothetical protein [Henriciella aquimarina]|uniref:hypothetical protein n=1 Tax=Henriciella aquimarina TaxID=545261 RepID=UPI000A03897C|nr:hypothetical protein [Henriciella aquimarina]